MSECVLKTLACRGLRVGPSKLSTVEGVVRVLFCCLLSLKTHMGNTGRTVLGYRPNFELGYQNHSSSKSQQVLGNDCSHVGDGGLVWL